MADQTVSVHVHRLKLVLDAMTEVEDLCSVLQDVIKARDVTGEIRWASRCMLGRIRALGNAACAALDDVDMSLPASSDLASQVALDDDARNLVPSAGANHV